MFRVKIYIICCSFGGDILARETVDKIKDAELSADKLQEAARKKAEVIIERAKEEASKTLKTTVKEAKSKASLMTGIARSQAKRRAQEYLDSAKEELDMLDNIAKAKKRDAIKLILEQVI